jgi:hypothetical protein
MAKLKPVTDDELVRALVRIEDVRDQAEDLVRRMNGKGNESTPMPELPVDRASTVLAASGALIELAAMLLRPAWVSESTKGGAS